MANELLKVRDLCKTFDKGKKNEVTVAYHINLTIREGECVAVVGESGCGKSSLAKLITVITPSDSGTVTFEGEELTRLHGAALRNKRRHIQMVFQQPMSAISPRMSIGTFLKVPLENFNIVPKADMEAEVDRLLAMVQLPAFYKTKLPHEVSGGELQRVMIARAMAGRPKLLICDEATSALDVAVQQDIVALIKKLQTETGVACLFITHDLSLVHQVSHRVIVMYRGRIVEELESSRIVSGSLHPYTKLLLSSVFTVNCDQSHVPDVMPEDAAVVRRAEACPFYGRCPRGRELCGQNAIRLLPIEGDVEHYLACPYAKEEE